MTSKATREEIEARTQERGLTKLGQPPESTIRYVVAVMSGKGGVGKSSVSALLASEIARAGYQVGILDADITGPSIPRLFGLSGTPPVVGSYFLPEKSKLGVRVMSVGFFLEHQDDPVIWRGPLIGGAIKQFWTDVLWGDLDYLVVDLPPGTGDAPLTVLQLLPVDAVVMVTTPQTLALNIVKKAVTMAQLLQVSVLGFIENMAYITCPGCGKRIEPFGGERVQEASSYLGVPLIGSLPMDPRISTLGDEGRIEEYRAEFLLEVAHMLERRNGNTSNETVRGHET
ncbi:MAG TPA: Mrp/NBP35 family ATP-binding protein [Firmicutes bacterium]|nr:Mrp/NBP35 family ATP-binding protein [Candidatus Fermentithermobacillaceae bacterium]